MRGLLLGPPHEARTLTRDVGTGLENRLAATDVTGSGAGGTHEGTGRWREMDGDGGGYVSPRAIVDDSTTFFISNLVCS